MIFVEVIFLDFWQLHLQHTKFSFQDGLELRLYPARNVVCTTYRAFQVPSRDMFMKLFRYIDGDNEKSKLFSLSLKNFFH